VVRKKNTIIGLQVGFSFVFSFFRITIDCIVKFSVQQSLPLLIFVLIWN